MYSAIEHSVNMALYKCCIFYANVKCVDHKSTFYHILSMFILSHVYYAYIMFLLLFIYYSFYYNNNNKAFI